MKHIKKKFLFSVKTEMNAKDLLGTVEPNTKYIERITESNFIDHAAYMVTEDGKIIQTFKYEKDGKTLFIPEPNPIVIYFSNAQMILKPLIDTKKDLLDSLIQNKDVGITQSFSYQFFGHASNFVTSLFNALEAFINSKIPDDFEYRKEGKQKTELYNKRQLQESLRFEEKIKKVIPQIMKKPFHQDFGHKYEILTKFKDIRDNVVHTREHEENIPNYYEKLFTELLDHDYLKSIQAVRDYINYYENNLIEKCQCGNDY